MKISPYLLAIATAVLIAAPNTLLAAYNHAWNQHKIIDLLADGLGAWENTDGWKTGGKVTVNPKNKRELLIVEPGEAIAVVEKKSRAAYLLSKELHSDIAAAVEFMVPRGSNSGIYFMGRYEIQILDSFGKTNVEFKDCGGIYRRRGPNPNQGHPPRVNASTAPGTWQKFEIIFRGPRFDESGKKVESARFVKVVHNGQLIHQNVEVPGPTVAAMQENQPEAAMGPIRIQGDHGPVAFRTFKIEHLELE